MCFMKKVIYIGPGGLRGFYSIGVSKFIKEHYALDDFEFYGSSAGSWNALFLSFKWDNHEFLDNIKRMEQTQFDSLYSLQRSIGDKILKTYSDNDFHMEKINICVGSIQKLKIKQNMYSDFNNLKDVVDCCIASSHIPYISKRTLFQMYREKSCFDGGFFRTMKNKDNEIIIPQLTIYPGIWQNKELNAFDTLQKLNISNLINKGYEDSLKNREVLNKVFIEEQH